jgi:hypothetical protein
MFTNWTVGLLNGYKQKENGLPNDIKYGTMGLTTFAGILKVLGNFDKYTNTARTPGQLASALLLGVSLAIGANFCLGHHMGKAIRYVEDQPRSNKGNVKITLL